RLLVLGEAGLEEHAAEGGARLALEHDEAPGLELLVVGHAGRRRQDRLELGRAGSGSGQHGRLDRPALQEEIEKFLAHGRTRDPGSRSSPSKALAKPTSPRVQWLGFRCK